MNLFRNRLFRFVVLVISFGLCLSAGGTILNLWSRRDHVLTRQRDFEVITQENRALQEQLKEAKSAEYLERIARDKLGLVKDGETIVIVPQSSQKMSRTKTQDLPNWQKWWSLFF